MRLTLLEEPTMLRILKDILPQVVILTTSQTQILTGMLWMNFIFVLINQIKIIYLSKKNRMPALKYPVFLVKDVF